MVRSQAGRFFKPPWPFNKKGNFGYRKIGPHVYEKMLYPGQNREFPELTPKFQKLNPVELRGYTGVRPSGYEDPVTREFVLVKEMVPELIVPDLTGFQLKPYVSYKTDVEIEKKLKSYQVLVQKKGSEEAANAVATADERWPPTQMEAKTMFDLFYADKVRKAYRERVKDKEGKNVLNKIFR